MDGDRSVTQHRFRSRGGDGNRVRGARPTRRFVDEVVADRPKRAALFGRDDLQVRNAGHAPRAPVDERFGPVCEPVAVQARERFPHRSRGNVVHREPEAPPVERQAEATLLAEHHLARLVDEVPHAREVAITAEGLAGLALLGEDPIEDVLRGDRGVIEAWQPQRRMAEHAGTPDHRVFDREGQRVTDVERPGDVRRRLDDHERRQARVRRRALAVGREDLGIQPALVQQAFDQGGVVGLRQLGQASVGRCHRSHGFSGRPPNVETRSSSGRTGRGTTCWFGIRESPVIPAPGFERPLGTLSGASRATRERRSHHRSCADRSIPALSGWAGLALLLSVFAVRAGV